MDDRGGRRREDIFPFFSLKKWVSLFMRLFFDGLSFDMMMIVKSRDSVGCEVAVPHCCRQLLVLRIE